MPTRAFSEDSISQKKRKSLAPREEKPAKKSTKTIKQEIKKEPMDFSDDDINDDDVMDIEDADKTAKIFPKKRVIKTKKIKKVPKSEGDAKDKVKQKRKKKVDSQLAATAVQNNENTNGTTPKPPVVQTNNISENNGTPKPAKKTPKVKEKKIKEKKPQPPKSQVKKQTKPDGTSKPAGSDSESTVEETDTYETCGVTTCQRPSGMEDYKENFNNLTNHFTFYFTQNQCKTGFSAMADAKFGIIWCALVSRLRKSIPIWNLFATTANLKRVHKDLTAVVIDQVQLE